MSDPDDATGTPQDAQFAWLTTVFEAGSTFAGVLDSERRLVYLNQTARQILGIGPGEDISRMDMSSYLLWVAQPVGEVAFRTAIRGDIWFGDVRCRGRGGKNLLVSLVLASHISPDGTIDCFSMTADSANERTAEAGHLCNGN